MDHTVTSTRHQVQVEQWLRSYWLLVRVLDAAVVDIQIIVSGAGETFLSLWPASLVVVGDVVSVGAAQSVAQYLDAYIHSVFQSTSALHLNFIIDINALLNSCLRLLILTRGYNAGALALGLRR